MRQLFVFLFLFHFIAQPAFAHSDCEKNVKALGYRNASPISAAEVSTRVADDVRQSQNAVLGFLKAKRGYAVLIGTMIGSAALTSYLTARLPADFAFLSQLLAQLSTLGIYVFGSPIWEPISSGFRKFAFGVSKEQSPVAESNSENQRLESLWLKTQENYSLNSQMSRNIINLFIASTRQNFYEAHRAIVAGDEHYAADQVAEAAYRMRILFKDLPPNDVSVSAAIRSAFSSYVSQPAFTLEVEDRIQVLDREATNSLVAPYYKKILDAWFINAKNGVEI